MVHHHLPAPVRISLHIARVWTSADDPSIYPIRFTAHSVASTRRNLGLVILFFFLTITFALLGAGEFSAAHGVALAKAGGAFGIVTALVAFYVGTAEMLADPAQSWFRLPLGQIPKGRVD